MKRYPLALLLLIMACSEQPPNDPDRFSNASWQSLVLNGKYEQAIQIVESEAERIHFDDLRQILLLGELYTKSGNADRSLQFANELQVDSMYPTAAGTVGKCIEAYALISSGLIHAAENPSKRCYDQAIEGFPPLGRALMADITHLRGLVLHESGLLENAAEFYNISQSLRPITDWDFELRLAATLNNLANIYWSQGKLPLALTSHQKALSLKQAALPGDHVDISHSLNNIGAVLNDLGRGGEALQYHQRALHLRKHIPSAERYIGHSYHNLAVSFQFVDVNKASAYVDSAISAKLRVLPADHPELLNSISLKSDLLEYQDRLVEADSFRVLLQSMCDAKDFSTCDEIESKYIVSGLLLNDQSRASRYVSEKVKWGSVTPHKAYALISYSKWLTEHGQPQEAKDHLSFIFEHYWDFRIENIITLPVEQNRWPSPALLVEAINAYLEILLEDSRGDKRLRKTIILLARQCLEIIENDLSHPLPESTRINYESLGRRSAELGLLALEQNESENVQGADANDIFLFSDYMLNWEYQSVYADLLSFRKAGATKDDMRKYKNHIFSNSTITDSLRTSLVLKYPLYDLYRPRIRSYAFNSLKDQLTQRNAACILYSVVEDKLIAVVLSGAQASITNLGMLEDITQLINRIPSNLKLSTSDHYESLREVYEYIISPIEPYIEADNLIIVRNHFSNSVPFEALISKDRKGDQSPHYLVRDKSITHSYSVASIIAAASEPTTPPSFTSDLLAISPRFSTDEKYSESLLLYLSQVIPEFDPITDRLSMLPGANAEVEAIAKTLSSKNDWLPGFLRFSPAKLLTKSSSEHLFRSLNLESFRIIHFATHSFSHPTSTDSSAIILNEHEVGQHDGILFAHEIRDLTISPDLVVMSSCEGALERYTDGPGLSGFSTAFLLAGAKNLIASTWPSDDVSTLHLMQRFYLHLSNGKSVNLALRDAKIDIINMGGPISNPYYWAGFIHLGVPGDIVSSGT